MIQKHIADRLIWAINKSDTTYRPCPHCGKKTAWDDRSETREGSIYRISFRCSLCKGAWAFVWGMEKRENWLAEITDLGTEGINDV